LPSLASPSTKARGSFATEAQVLTYLRMTGKRIGLLMNFNSRLLKNGIKRFVL
jgi:GxxExxY protein